MHFLMGASFTLAASTLLVLVRTYCYDGTMDLSIAMPTLAVPVLSFVSDLKRIEWSAG